MAPKLFQKYDNCNQNVGQIQYWYTKDLKIMWFLWHQKIQKVSDFDSKHLRSIDYICKMFEKYRDCKEESSKIWYLKPNYSKRVFFGSNIQQVWNFYRNTRKVSDFSSEHSKSIELIQILFEKYCICKQNIRK